jgi:putative membrane protein
VHFVVAGQRSLFRRDTADRRAFWRSVLLLSYVTSKLTNAPVPFGGEGMIRYVYFFILVSHIILSIPVLPLALFSIYRGMTGEIEKHKSLVKWTFPIWMYVAITGVMVYVLMSPYY